MKFPFRRILTVALALGLVLGSGLPSHAAGDEEVIAQLRSSGFSDAMIEKILHRQKGGVSTGTGTARERVYPDEKPVPRADVVGDELPSTMIAQAETTAPAGDSGRDAGRKDRVLTIEELYGKDLYQEDQAAVQPVVLREETRFFPGIAAPNLMGSTGLFNLTSAYTLGKGRFAFGANMVYNTINRQNDKDINFLSGEYARQYYIPVTATFGVLDNLELGFVFPAQNWKINASELKPSNDSGSGMGDVKMRMKYKLPIQADSKSALALGFGVKFPTADKESMYVMGATEEADYEIFGVLSQALSHANVHVDVGYVFTGDPRSTRAGEKIYIDDKFRYNIGVDFSRADDLTISFELSGENWGGMGSKLEFVPGVRTLVNEDFAISAGLPITLFNDEEFGYDFKAIMGASYLF